MKPQALLLSCDKCSDFQNSFADIAADKLSIYSDVSHLPNVDYIYVFAGRDRNFIDTLKTFSTDQKVVIAAHQSSRKQLESLLNLPNVKIVYYANLLDINHAEGYLNSLLKSIQKKRVDLPSYDIDLQMVSLAELVNVMLECSFTFYSEGIHRFYIENGMSLYTFAGLIQKARSDIEFYSTSKRASVIDLESAGVKVEPDYDHIRQYIQNIETVSSQRRNISLPSINLSRFPLKKLAVRFAVLAAILPVLIFAVSALSLYVGYWGISNNQSISELGFKLAQLTAFHDPIKESAKVGQRVLAVSDSTTFDFENATPDELREYFANIEVSLNSLYKDLSFSDSLITSSSAIENRELVLSVHELISLAPILLGLEKKTSYAILFENEDQLDSLLYAEVEDGRVMFSRDLSISEIDSKVEGNVPAPFNADIQWSVADIYWEADFVAVSQRLRWFLDKSHDLNPETVLRVDISQKDLVTQYLATNSQLIQLDKLTQLLVLFKEGSITANSLNLKLQSYAESQNIASSRQKSDTVSVYINDYSETDMDKIDRELSLNIYINDSDMILESETLYQNTSDKQLSYYPRTFINAHGVESTLVELEPGETTVTKNSSTLELGDKSELDFYVNALQLDENLSVKIKVFNERAGLIDTIPHLNLTRDGALGYTTSLERPLSLQIILSK